jgi:AraC family transcriptional regulator
MESSSNIRVNIHGSDVSKVVESQVREDHYSLSMPLTFGRVRCLCNGKRYFEGALQPGMLRLGKPGERYLDYLEASTSPVRFLEIVVPGVELRRAFRKAGFIWPAQPGLFQPLLKPNHTISALSLAFNTTPAHDCLQRQNYIDGLTQALLACLVASQHFTSAFVRRLSTRTLSDLDFKHACEYADSMMGAKLSLSQWAAAIQMEVGEFANAFRERTRQSPYGWLIARRIECAKLLLSDQKLSIVDIALKTGFSSQSHFTETFRRRVGCSPARWKRAKGRNQDGDDAGT